MVLNTFQANRDPSTGWQRRGRYNGRLASIILLLSARLKRVQEHSSTVKFVSAPAPAAASAASDGYPASGDGGVGQRGVYDCTAPGGKHGPGGTRVAQLVRRCLLLRLLLVVWGGAKVRMWVQAVPASDWAWLGRSSQEEERLVYEGGIRACCDIIIIILLQPELNAILHRTTISS